MTQTVSFPSALVNPSDPILPQGSSHKGLAYQNCETGLPSPMPLDCSLKYTQPKWHAATCCMWHRISLAVGGNECDWLKIQHTGNLSSPSSKRMRMLGRGTVRLREAALWWPPDAKLHLLWPMRKTFCLKNKMYLDPLLCEMEHVVDMDQSPGIGDRVSFTTIWSPKILKNVLFFQSKHFARYAFQ